MLVLVIRHAIAEDREEFAATGREDGLRPLTPKGRRRMRRAAAGLRTVVPRIDILASSPLVRARETAEIIGATYRLDGVVTVDALTPDSRPPMLLSWLRGQNAEVAAIVGHEPHLSSVVSYLVAGGEGAQVELKKGGMCLVRFEGRARRGGGVLVWALPPAVLRSLAPD